jgi:hypothetical protein
MCRRCSTRFGPIRNPLLIAANCDSGGKGACADGTCNNYRIRGKLAMSNECPWYVWEAPTLMVSLNITIHLHDATMVKGLVNAYHNNPETIRATVDPADTELCAGLWDEPRALRTSGTMIGQAGHLRRTIPEPAIPTHAPHDGTSGAGVYWPGSPDACPGRAFVGGV